MSDSDLCMDLKAKCVVIVGAKCLIVPTLNAPLNITSAEGREDRGVRSAGPCVVSAIDN